MLTSTLPAFVAAPAGVTGTRAAATAVAVPGADAGGPAAPASPFAQLLDAASDAQAVAAGGNVAADPDLPEPGWPHKPVIGVDARKPTLPSRSDAQHGVRRGVPVPPTPVADGAAGAADVTSATHPGAEAAASGDGAEAPDGAGTRKAAVEGAPGDAAAAAAPGVVPPWMTAPAEPLVRARAPSAGDAKAGAPPAIGGVTAPTAPVHDPVPGTEAAAGARTDTDARLPAATANAAGGHATPAPAPVRAAASSATGTDPHAATAAPAPARADTSALALAQAPAAAAPAPADAAVRHAAQVTESASGTASPRETAAESGARGFELPLTPLAAAVTPASAQPTPAAAEVPAGGRLDASPGSPEFATQLGAQLTTFVRDGVQHARLELHPAEMGPLTVQIQLDGPTAQVHLAAEHAATRAALEQAMPVLAGSLRDAGLTLSGGGVFEQPQQPQGGADGAGGGHAARDGQGGQGGRGGPSGGAAGAVADLATGVVATRHRGVVDLVA